MFLVSLLLFISVIIFNGFQPFPNANNAISGIMHPIPHRHAARSFPVTIAADAMDEFRNAVKSSAVFIFSLMAFLP